jgi:hypothetical protein
MIFFKNFLEDRMCESDSSLFEDDLDKDTLLAEKQDLIETLQEVHYQLSQADTLDDYSVEQIANFIEQILCKYDSF